MKDPKELFNSSLEGNARRAIDFHEGDKINEAAFKALIPDASNIDLILNGDLPWQAGSLPDTTCRSLGHCVVSHGRGAGEPAGGCGSGGPSRYEVTNLSWFLFAFVEKTRR